MKKHYLLLLIAILSFNSFSQISFKKGYYINNNDEKINCFIKTVDWNNNPIEFEYKLSKTSELKKGTLKFVKEFGIDNSSKYIKAEVMMDRSSELLNKISSEKNPKFNNEEVFLKVLVEGKANLYQYIEKSLTRYFYELPQLSIEQLIFKSYKTTGNKIAKNNDYKKQLYTNLKCKNINFIQIDKIAYNKNDLIQFFKEYGNCEKTDLIYLEPNNKRNLINLTLRPRLNNSSLTLQNSGFSSRDIIEFGNKTGLGIGLELEVVLPINKEKWSILIEPTYQNYISETVNNDVSVIFGGEIKSKVEYNSIEIPIGLRHYFYLNNRSSIFINTSYIFDLSSNSFFEFERSDITNTIKENLNTDQNLSFGIGYKLKNKYSIELRYQTSRELIKLNNIWSSDYKTFSFVLGYSIF